MGFSCSFGTEFHEIEIVFHMRKQTCYGDELFTTVHHRRIQTNSMNKEINPLFCSEILALVYIFLNIHIRNLNRFKCLYLPTYTNVFTTEVAHGNNTPNPISRK